MPFTFKQGSIPLLVSIPHNGSAIPHEVARTMTDDGRSSRDTDWFLDRLYDFPELEKASVIAANYSRYVIDLNRPCDNESLYPGQTTTGLIPETCFDGAPIYSGELPDENEIARRIETTWSPYHAKITDEIARLKSEHGIAFLIEAHSIASVVPRLFEGTLRHFNFGTNSGKSCPNEVVDRMTDVIDLHPRYNYVVNGRFVGGYITRHFGRPDDNVFAMQIELSQATYMDEESLTWDAGKAGAVQLVFRELVSSIQRWIR